MYNDLASDGSEDHIQLSQTESKVIFGLRQQPCAILARSQREVVCEQESSHKCTQFHTSDCNHLSEESFVEGITKNLRFLPIQLKGPMEKGAKASGCLIISGLEYHRSGTKEDASV